jgi:hypothetical protein
VVEADQAATAVVTVTEATVFVAAAEATVVVAVIEATVVVAVTEATTPTGVVPATAVATPARIEATVLAPTSAVVLLLIPAAGVAATGVVTIVSAARGTVPHSEFTSFVSGS